MIGRKLFYFKRVRALYFYVNRFFNFAKDSFDLNELIKFADIVMY